MLIVSNEDKTFIVGQDGLKVQAFSSFLSAPVYTVSLENPVQFLNTQNYTEEVLFISKQLSELRLQVVLATDPESRVRKLIKYGQLEKAGSFAKAYGVSPFVVDEAKALSIVSKSELNSQDLDDLLGILDTFPSKAFRLECWDAVTCIEAVDMRRVISCAAFMDIDLQNPVSFALVKFFFS